MKQYYVKKDGQPFGDDPNDLYVVVKEDNELFTLHGTGGVEYLSCLSTPHMAWKNVTEQHALSLILRQYNYKPLQNVLDLWVTNKEKVTNNDIFISEFSSPQCFDTITTNAEKSPLLYRYVRYAYDNREIQGNGGITFGIVINYTDKILMVYPVICSDGDTFSKKIAKSILYTRVMNSQYIIVSYDPSYDLVDNIAKEVIKGAYTITGDTKTVEELNRIMITLKKMFNHHTKSLNIF